MEMQFGRSPVEYLQKLTGQLRSQEQTLEVRLPDGMPDIGRVLGAWGQVLVRGKEWNSDHMAVSCGVMAWVLYKPENEEAVRSVEAWLPFSMKWDLPDTQYDGKILTSCLLKSVDARSISARKLMVRATLGAMGEAWLAAETQLAVPCDLPEDVKLLEGSYPVLLPREVGEKAFVLDEQLSIPASGSKPEKLLYYSLQPEIVDRKVMSGKVVFRGVGMLHLLYRGEDGRLYNWDYELPFSQYADLDGTFEQEAVIQIYPCVTSLDIALDDNGALQVKAGILGQFLLFDRSVLTVAEDAYSPRRVLTLQQEQLQLPAILDQTTQMIRGEQTVQADVQQIVDLSFFPEYAPKEGTDEEKKFGVSGLFQMLYYDPEGELRSMTTPWEGEWSQRTAEDSSVSAWLFPMGKPQAIAGAGSVNLKADVSLEATTTSGRGISMISAMEIGELEKPNPDRPSLILCKKGRDSLWDIAKRTGSTVEAIMKANQLEKEPEDQCVLLIPVS